MTISLSASAPFFSSRFLLSILVVCQFPLSHTQSWAMDTVLTHSMFLSLLHPPSTGSGDMCCTARIFRLKHNICTKSTSTMLNLILAALLPVPAPSTIALLHFFCSQVDKKNPQSPELLNLKRSEIEFTHIQVLMYYWIFIQTNVSQLQSFRDQSNPYRTGPPDKC